MKPKPQSLTSPRTLLLAAFIAGVVVTGRYSPFRSAITVAQEPTEEARAADKKTAAKVSEKTAAEVFSAVEQALDGAGTLECRIQQTITLSGQRYLAAGSFLQSTSNRMRLEYKIYPVRQLNAADEGTYEPTGEPEDTAKLEATGSLTQVSDGSVLWNYWVNGKDKSLTRRNLQEIQEAAAKVPNKDGLLNLQSLGVGGLKALMANLRNGMEFGTVTEQDGEKNTFLVLAGRWDESTRTKIFKVPAESAAVLPAYIPDYVRVFVEKTTMLPWRIQYLKKHPNPEVKKVRPIMTIDFRGMKRVENPDANAFVFEPPELKEGEELDEVDVTGQVILGLQQLTGATQKTQTEPETAEQAPANAKSDTAE